MKPASLISSPNTARVSERARVLTVSGHAHQQAFLEAALLAAVPVDPHDGAALVLQALLVLDVLLDAPPEEALSVFTDTGSLLLSSLLDK